MRPSDPPVEGSESPILVFERRQPWFTWQSLVVMGVTLGMCSGLVAVAQEEQSTRLLWAALGAGAVITTATVLWRMRARRRPGTPVELMPGYIRLPRLWGGTDDVPYRELRNLNVVGRGKRQRLVVGGDKRIYVLSLSYFVRDDALDAIRSSVRARIGQGPDGAERLIQLEQREQRASAAWRNQTPVGVALLLLLGAVFAAMHFTGSLDPVRLVQWGANAAPLVWQGDWFRLFTANFLHGSLLHVSMNAVALSSLGGLLERLIGSVRSFLVLASSALGGSLVSALVAPGLLSVGASTAAFGVLGGLATLQLRFRDRLPGGFAQSRRWWLFVLGINGLLPFVVPVIDWAAHAGGFLVGLAVTFLISRGPQALGEHPASRNVKAWAAALGVMYVAAFAVAWKQYDSPRRWEAVRELAQAAPPEQKAMLLNGLAWQLATSPSVTAAQLELAESSAREALSLADGAPAIQDTLATVWFRQGHIDRAIAAELEALQQNDKAIYATQLARFLLARPGHEGPLILDDGSPNGVPQGQVELTRSTDGDEAYALRAIGPLPHGARVYWLAMGAEDRPRFMAVTEIDPMPDESTSPIRVPLNPRAPGTTPQIALIDARPVDARAADADLSGSYWDVDPEVLDLP